MRIISPPLTTRGAGNLASLIARYATHAILPEVVQKLDQHKGDWKSSGIQDDLLAYILRVDRSAAKPRIEKTIVARRKECHGCNSRTFSSIAAIHYDPVLEEIAIHALDDPDPDLAADAATMLSNFGSPAAEAPLWRRYEKWSKRWAGHESQLNVSEAEYDLTNYRVSQRALGRSLFAALATAQGWLTDQAKLRQLAGANKVQTIMNDADRCIEMWNHLPLTLKIDCAPRFHAHIAQYQFDSMDALKKKVSQFPQGTKLLLWWPSNHESNQQCIADLRAFLATQGMSLEDEKRRE